MQKYSLNEIFQIALRMEENGEKFYRQIAKEAVRDDVKKIFLKLAEEEIEHKKLFQEMLKAEVLYAPIEYYPEEYFEYIKSYADDFIFTKEKKEKIVYSVHNTIEAIDVAINMEKDSVWYYSEIKGLVEDKYKNSIDKIIEEERKHFSLFVDLKSKIINKI
jgi:rubrerythrin